jgi:predicted MPP superfamily phosphohydrolase
MVFLLALAFLFSWVGHACIWTAILSNFYGRAWPKWFLRLWRYATALILLVFPELPFWLVAPGLASHVNEANDRFHGVWGQTILVYLAICLLFGAVILPCITAARLLRKKPACLFEQKTRTLDLWPELGTQLIGDNKLAAMTRLAGNGVFRIDITDLSLALPNLPAEWEGLTLLVLSDLHFHGTPSRLYFERILDELESGPRSDLVCLLGDYVDTDSHHEWIKPLLGRLNAREAKLAILGNHDIFHDPERVRRELAAIGCRVLGNGWQEITIRGVRCLAVGNEGPWFTPGPDLSGAPSGLFRLVLSHTPDNFYWGVANSVGLMLCGHVHGGAIRVPLIGPIFVPSVFGRRFDSGVFALKETTMVVSRGISGREPLRLRCNPQVIRITLRSPVLTRPGLREEIRSGPNPPLSQGEVAAD